MRSVDRDVKAMAQGIDAIEAQINILNGNVKLRKAERKRLERLNAIKVQMIDNPKDCKKLVKRYKEMS
jgi:hypothetical protein